MNVMLCVYMYSNILVLIQKLASKLVCIHVLYICIFTRYKCLYVHYLYLCICHVSLFICVYIYIYIYIYILYQDIGTCLHDSMCVVNIWPYFCTYFLRGMLNVYEYVRVKWLAKWWRDSNTFGMLRSLLAPLLAFTVPVGPLNHAAYAAATGKMRSP